MCMFHNTSAKGFGVDFVINKRVFERKLERAVEVFGGTCLSYKELYERKHKDGPLKI